MSLVRHNRTTVAKPTRNIFKTRKNIKKTRHDCRKNEEANIVLRTSHAQRQNLDQQGIAPGAARRYAPADSRSTVAYRFAANQAVKYPKIFADLRPSAAGSAVRTSLAAGGG